ncbi:T9SS type A sorting domain-containing protein [Dyadobacter sp. CY326]|uniref:T9SS type A sorting domain-containing protein n=1 Tax=Dyadobacter sp. CY326 TaxID=2907300 RepID=UPI001F23E563|nr:T9SS type A sorting domain-containing protein [Dyadobacter sp. CY326]MCE7066548.1 T9SS type A sorting domain-containing protein [Dyadobacter sp. CY326]
MKSSHVNLSTIFLLLSTLFNFAFAVDPIVYVKGMIASTIYDGIDFYGLEPSSSEYSTEYSYIPYIVFPNGSVIPNGAAKEYEWKVIGGDVVGENNKDKVSAKWYNTANYNGGAPTKSVRLTVTFTWKANNVNYTKKITSIRPSGANEAQPIEVKYISVPSSISFNGSTVGNGSTLAYACGAAAKTLSIPAVSTDPAAPVTYYFYYPANWSGPASSNTPSVTVNTHANSGGVIKVEAKRNDSNFRTKISFNITRPLPTIPTINSGPILLCAPKDITASASNATSYNWASTGGITVSSPGNTNVAHLTGVSDGTVKVSATNSVCGVTTAYSTPVQVKRSAPLPASLLVTANGGGSPDFMCNGAGVSLNAYTSEPETKFSVWTTSDPANAILNSNGGTAYFNSYVNNCYGVDVTASNCFGSVKKGITICVDNCLKDGTVYEIYPNPANDFIYITFEDKGDAKALPETISIYSEASAKEVKSISAEEFVLTDDLNNKKTISIQVSDLPRGTYYFQLVHSTQVLEKVRIVLN